MPVGKPAPSIPEVCAPEKCQCLEANPFRNADPALNLQMCKVKIRPREFSEVIAVFDLRELVTISVGVVDP